MSDIGSIAQTAGNWLRADTSGRSWNGGLWFEQLQPGSWRGKSFVTEADQTITGRRIALHEYPYRDTVWAEDLGRLPRRFVFTAFLVGDDVYQQRNAMVQACEQVGKGTLVHPTFGSVECVLLDARFGERTERGRVVEINFAFIAAGDLTFPTALLATGDNVRASADALDDASRSDLGLQLGSLSAIPQQVTSSISGYTKLAIDAVNDPVRSISAVTGLGGFYGRYSMGSRSTLQSTGSTVTSALGASITTRQAVLDASALLETEASTRF
jgi:prophage DNA circulation protein